MCIGFSIPTVSELQTTHFYIFVIINRVDGSSYDTIASTNFFLKSFMIWLIFICSNDKIDELNREVRDKASMHNQLKKNLPPNLSADRQEIKKPKYFRTFNLETPPKLIFNLLKFFSVKIRH